MFENVNFTMVFPAVLIAGTVSAAVASSAELDFHTGTRLEVPRERLDDAFLQLMRKVNRDKGATEPNSDYEWNDEGFWRFRSRPSGKSVSMTDVFMDHERIACVEKADRVRCVVSFFFRRSDPSTGPVDGLEFRGAQWDLVFERSAEGALQAILQCDDEGNCKETKK